MTNYMETKYPGGINKLIKEIAEALSKKGHELIVIQPNPYNLPNEEVYKKFRIIRINSWFRDFYGLNLNAYFYIKNFLKEYKVDLVHIHGYQTFFSLIIIIQYKNLVFLLTTDFWDLIRELSTSIFLHFLSLFLKMAGHSRMLCRGLYPSASCNRS